jgi:hypothetical protein
LCLLAAAGVTATVVGYRVKKADWDRKKQLLATYEALGGSFETLMTPSKSVLTPEQSDTQRTFASVYETNQRAREYGVFSVIDSSSAEHLTVAITSLAQIGANEASRTLEDTRKALQAAAPDTPRSANTQAQKFARQYGRPMARETEAKLFRYLDTNRATILNQQK